VRAAVIRGVAFLLVLLACESPVGFNFGPGQWDVVLRLPLRDIFSLAASPDGALFVSTFQGEVYRAPPGQPAAWTRIVQQPSSGGFVLERLFAPSAHTFFAISGSHTLRWDEGMGLREDRTPLSDSVVFCGDFFTGPHLEDIWGRNDHDVFAVGDHGLIVHYDGRGWTVVPNVLSAVAPSLCYESDDTDLYAVGGDASQVYAAGYSVIRRAGNGEWVSVSRPVGSNLGGDVRGVAAQAGIVLLGGGEFERSGNYPNYQFTDPARLFLVAAARWESLLGANPPLFELSGGSAQPGESAVFWGYDGGIAVVTGASVRMISITAFGSQLRGAVAVGGSVYATGMLTDADVVVRLRL